MQWRPIELGSLRLDNDTHIVALHCRRACTCSELFWDRIERRPLERRVCDCKFKRFLLYMVSLALLRLPGAVDSVLGAVVPRWHRAVLSGYNRKVLSGTMVHWLAAAQFGHTQLYIENQTMAASVRGRFLRQFSSCCFPVWDARFLNSLIVFGNPAMYKHNCQYCLHASLRPRYKGRLKQPAEWRIQG